MASKQTVVEVNPLDAIQAYSREKGLSKDIVLNILKESLVYAYLKELGLDTEELPNLDYEVEFGPKNNVIILLPKKVVETESNFFEISIKNAKEIQEEIEIGSIIHVKEKSVDLSRIFSNQAKQMVFQRLKDLEREILYKEFKSKEGELTHGYFQRWINKEIMCIDLGKVEGIMPKREQTPGEKYKSGDRLKAIISRVEMRKDRFNETGLSITLSRASSDFVKKLFEMEIPEIYEGLVEIINIARVASIRTKIVVKGVRSDIDPVGACVGMKGVRIQSIVRELGNERIDIIQFSENPVEFITNAISPAKPTEVKVDFENREALVVVPDESLSLAIGSSGSNVKLAVQLTGFKIDIKSASQHAQDMSSPEARERLEKLFNNNLTYAMSKTFDNSNALAIDEEIGTPLTEITGLMPRVIRLLESGGIKDIETLIEMNPEDLAKVQGIGPTTAEQIFKLISESVELVEEN
jgi:transcription termination/antitermination protein NusA